ncbi:MAG TPA: BamA/TamA family outer membrane protein, partial [Candidatus Dormibacteraeota bacterium]|nr:BamA/TamA family outer membrane protein [Candidatus Dormibacteraeota bacterium]
GKKPHFFGADFVEDSSLILTSKIKRDGYLKPEVSVELTLQHGGHMHVTADELLENPLPEPLRIVRVQFNIKKGRLYYFSNLRFEGLETLKEKQARSYFVETGTLIPQKRNKVFTPENLRHGLSSLTDVLERQGFQDAKSEAIQVQTNNNTGAVSVRIRVEQGPKYIVRSVTEQFYYENGTLPKETTIVLPKRPYSRVWEQDFTLALRTNQYRRGYPDTTVRMKTLEKRTEGSLVRMEMEADVKSGPQVRLGAVEFAGEKRTKETVMRRRVRVERGDLLDPVRVEEGRYRLAQLGVFSTVDLSYDPEDEHTRDVRYQVKEGKTLQVSLLFGYGAYELLRGGVELELYNLWGSAHRVRLRAIQSFKSSSGDFTYTMPELVGKDVDVFLNGTGLRREEIDFTRLEYGGGLGAHKFFQAYSTDASVRYNYQILNTLSTFPAVATEGLTNPAVGAFITDLKLDRRDNPLYPRRGYKIFLNLETATAYIGGDANYVRPEVSTSWHLPLGGGRWLAVGISHGDAVSFGSVADNLPFNRRFFPGGDTSIRGFQQGEASPRNAHGQIVGAETYSLGSMELEQALTRQFSLVVFSDNLGFAHRLEDFPWDTGLFSVGGGIRWKTIIGPARLEYGYNLNPRPHDPTGTLQFSLGYPF